MRDDRGIADAFYTVLTVGIVVLAGLALAAAVLDFAGGQGKAAADQLTAGSGALKKGIWGLYYTMGSPADRQSADPGAVPPGGFVARRIDPAPAVDPGSLPAGSADEGVIIWTGSLLVRDAGDYTFELASSGGSWLWLDSDLVADNRGEHGLEPATSSPLHLTAGYHRLKARCFYEGRRNASFHVRWSAGGAWSQLPCYV